METSSSQAGSMARELQRDLARKYRMHGAAVKEAWRSFNGDQRKQCLRAGFADGAVMKHREDKSLGEAWRITPELNLRDITEPGSDFLLELLEHRATNNVLEQYFAGPNNSLGDLDFIQLMMRQNGLRHAEASRFANSFSLFLGNDNQYGAGYKFVGPAPDEAAAVFGPAIRAGQAVSQEVGELILMRQTTMLQSLNIIVEDILDQGSGTRRRQGRPKKKSDDEISAALSSLAIKAPPKKLSMPDLIALTADRTTSLNGYLTLLSTEPVVLAHTVNIWFFSRPELVPARNGRGLPVHTDAHISPAFFDAVHAAFKAAAIWSYLTRLLQLLETSTSDDDKIRRDIVTQELASICHLEYTRSQGLFKRYVQCSTGSKRFKRMPNELDSAGNARVVLKCNPEDLTRADPQLHYMVRLCQPETNANDALQWIKKLSDLHNSHPEERDKLQEREVDSLCDLAIIIGFIQDLSPVVPMPSLRPKGQFFSRLRELETELTLLGKSLDLRDFAVPIDNLLEPGIAEAALKAMDEFVVDKAGTKMGFLYQDLIEDSIADLEALHDRAKAKKAEAQGKEQWIPFPTSAAPSQSSSQKRVELRRQKEKTRPSQPSAYEITPSAAPETEVKAAAPIERRQTLTVSASTAATFATLFDKSKPRTGSVPWSAFEAALAEVGFSVLPKYGSVYTFFPPETMEVRKPLTLHRPHQSRIERYLILVYAQRLKQLYGWDEQTFLIG